MKTSTLREWAHAPWHSWLKDSPEWLALFAELWSRIPERAAETLITNTRTLIVLPPVNYGRVIRITTPLPLGAHILQLDARLLERPRAEALGILAHELAHLWIAASGNTVTAEELENDLHADKTARTWGFEVELTSALERDLEKDHPRRLKFTT